MNKKKILFIFYYTLYTTSLVKMASSKIIKIVITDDDDYVKDVKDVKDVVYEEKDHTSEECEECEECLICCDVKISLVKCPYCSYSACESCYQKVIITSVTKPSCVSCKKQFNDDFFYENFSDSFIKKKYKKHREDILFKMEEALLPETQPHVERIKRREALKCEYMEIELQIKELRDKQLEIKKRINDTHNVEDDKEKEVTVVCPCPVSDCRGFLNDRYKCGICGVKACGQCREVKNGKDHKCDPDTVKTVEELKKNCRNCPNCMIPIYKISGCNQMFCVKCKVAFDWVSGKIETGLVHNPHYFEWLKENGGVPRNPHERECGGLPDYNALYTSKSIRNLGTSHQYIIELFRSILHIQEVTLPRLPTAMDNNSNLDLRIDYMMKKIEKEDFMKKLVRREKDKTKFIEYRQIMEMYYNVVSDLFRKLIDDLEFDYNIYDMQEIVRKFIENEQKIKEHSNESIKSLTKKYGSRAIHLI